MAGTWSHPTRVALFTDTYDDVSGVGTTFRRLADWCRKRGAPLEIFTVSPERSSTEQLGAVTIHRLKPRLSLNYYPGLHFDLLPLDDAVLGRAGQRSFDVVHVATPGHMGISGIYLAWQQAAPLVGSYHTELPQYVSQRLTEALDDSYLDDPEALDYVQEVSAALTWDYLACFYNYCTRVLVPSEATRRVVAERLRPPLHLFPRGVDTELYTPARRRRGDEAVRLLYVGRLAVEKNLGWLVRFAARHPELPLDIVGDGPLRAELERAMPAARFHGFLRGQELAAAYADADIFAFPSLTETFGNVVLEAQASGLPAVVADRGGPPEIIEHGRSGLVADDEGAFEAALLSLAADPARRRQMGTAARARAEGRSWDEVFEGLLSQWRAVRYPPRRVRFKRMIRRIRESEHPLAAGAVAFWLQFGRNRARRAAAANPLPSRDIRRRFGEEDR